MIERIKQIIEDEQLKKNCNRPEKVYRRWFFYCYLRKQKFYFREIAEMFCKHHATIIHGIRQAEFFENQKDSVPLFVQYHYGNKHCVFYKFHPLFVGQSYFQFHYWRA